jgi:hypothetical protein
VWFVEEHPAIMHGGAGRQSFELAHWTHFPLKQRSSGQTRPTAHPCVELQNAYQHADGGGGQSWVAFTQSTQVVLPRQ